MDTKHIDANGWTLFLVTKCFGPNPEKITMAKKELVKYRLIRASLSGCRLWTYGDCFAIVRQVPQAPIFIPLSPHSQQVGRISSKSNGGR